MVDPADLWGGCYGLDAYDWGWWWKGWVSIDGYSRRDIGYAGFTGRRWVNVPVNQPRDWYYSQVP